MLFKPKPTNKNSHSQKTSYFIKLTTPKLLFISWQPIPESKYIRVLIWKCYCNTLILQPTTQLRNQQNTTKIAVGYIQFINLTTQPLLTSTPIISKSTTIPLIVNMLTVGWRLLFSHKYLIQQYNIIIRVYLYMEPPKKNNQEIRGLCLVALKQCKKVKNPNNLHFEIKYAKLRRTYNQKQYDKLKNDSTSQIILINNLPNRRDHRINSQASLPQYQNLLKNLQADRQIQKFKKTTKQKFSLNLDSERYNYIIGRQGWYKETKEQIFQNQSDIIINKKQFRCDMSYRQTILDNDLIEEVRKTVKSKIQWGGVLRFKKQTDYYFSLDYRISLTQIYQSSYKQDFDNFKKVIFEPQQDFHKYFDKTFQENQKNSLKYEAQLRFLPKGIQNISNLSLDDFIAYFAGILDFFSNSSSQSQSLNEMIKKIKVKQ